MKQKAVIIGAGPAGLTAAYELSKTNTFTPLILERSKRVGGLSTTITYKGNKIDIGGHRFFTKSDTIMQWWLSFLPIEKGYGKSELTYHGRKQAVTSKHLFQKRNKNDVMMIRNRLSRIYYKGKFFEYPLELNLKTIQSIGVLDSFWFLFSYIQAIVRPIKPEITLEDFFINRFGKKLYETFFKTYTEKVWGKKCSEIPALWGKQRVKGLSMKKAVVNGVLKMIRPQHFSPNKKTETSLIEKFLYPKYGPGQLWNLVSKVAKKNGAELKFESEIESIHIQNSRVSSITYRDRNQKKYKTAASVVISSISIQELVPLITPPPPKKILQIAAGLEYRDFLVVGILLKKTTVKLHDNWLYIHDPIVKVGRIQIFNNWSPSMVKDKKTVWIGMEYFSNTDDDFWKQKDIEIITIAKKEIAALGLASEDMVIDATIYRAPKAYPAYTGSYSQFEALKRYLNRIENLFLIGRNGMHKYNNQDHSMLTAIEAVNIIVEKRRDKNSIWDINTEEEYHETK